MSYDNCPNCANPLAPPLSSGRQVCGRCSWVSQTTKTSQVNSIAARSSFSASVPVVAHPIRYRRGLSVLCHASLFLNLVGLALIILLWQLHPDEVVKQNAKEALNFHITLWVYLFGLIPLLLLAPKLVLALFCLIVIGALMLPVVAMISCLLSRDTPFTYPLILHIL